MGASHVSDYGSSDLGARIAARESRMWKGFGRKRAVACALPIAVSLFVAPICNLVAIADEPKSPTCGCPKIAPLATSDKPAPGAVELELSYADLEAIFSNRVLAYGGDWNKALVVLAHELDPGGELGIWYELAPTASATVPVAEGGMSEFLLTGTQAPPDPRGNRWRTVATGDRTMIALLNTIARSNKYGEPVFGLRAAALRSARFLYDDLAGVARAGAAAMRPSDPARSQRINAITAGARTQFVTQFQYAAGVVTGAAPTATPRPSNAGAKDRLTLDAPDIVNAALDALRSVDAKGKVSGLLLNETGEAADRDENLTPLVFQLVGLAAVRAEFGGDAAPQSPADALGCKAHSILMALADVTQASGWAVRRALWELFFQGGRIIDNRNPRELAVARAVLVQAGMASREEVEFIAANSFKTLAGLARPSSSAGDLAAEDDMVSMIRIIVVHAGGPGTAALRQELANRLEAEFDDFQQRQTRGVGSADEQRIIDKWNAARDTWVPHPAAPLCAPAGAPPEVVLFAKGVFGLIVVDRLYQSDPQNIHPLNVPLIVAVLFEEPYDGTEYPIAVEVEGEKVQLVAKPVDAKRMLFRTEEFFVFAK